MTRVERMQPRGRGMPSFSHHGDRIGMQPFSDLRVQMFLALGMSALGGACAVGGRGRKRMERGVLDGPLQAPPWRGGSILKPKDGRYQVRVSLPTGRRVARYAKTVAEATRPLAELRRQVQTGGLPASSALIAVPGGGVVRPGTLTVAQLAEVVLRLLQEQRRPRTVERYSSIVQHHILPHLGAVRVRVLTPLQIQAWLTQLTTAGRGVRTIEQSHAVLRILLGYAER